MVEELKIAIVGSGIIGMTTAQCLSEAGYQVAVISKDHFGKRLLL